MALYLRTVLLHNLLSCFVVLLHGIALRLMCTVQYSSTVCIAVRPCVVLLVIVQLSSSSKLRAVYMHNTYRLHKQVNYRRSARVGNADLRKGNIFLRSVTRSVSGRALAAVREAAVHRLLDAGTETTSGRAGVKTRPQNSHVVKLESSPQLTKLSDLRCADRGR